MSQISEEQMEAERDNAVRGLVLDMEADLRAEFELLFSKEFLGRSSQTDEWFYIDLYVQTQWVAFRAAAKYMAHIVLDLEFENSMHKIVLKRLDRCSCIWWISSKDEERFAHAKAILEENEVQREFEE